MAHKVIQQQDTSYYTVFEISNAASTEESGNVHLTLYDIPTVAIPESVYEALKEAGFALGDIDEAFENLYTAALARILAKRMRKIC